MGNSRTLKAGALSIVLAVLGQPLWAVCAVDKVTVSGPWGRAHFTVDVADDPQERASGLMFVAQMPMLTGMLFVYERPQSVSFWMKNTLIPLDILFVSPTGEVLAIHDNAVPGDLTPIAGGDGVQMVLEINGGLARRLGIGVGDVLQHPSFGPEAISPCVENSDS
ncbi:DUF192 domain-containing protein [Yoonia sp.]|jgi:uncharacterized membrane protein (UPF0127 family)|uniref:DUF192 domain-containing protein n=1 Tax=Yoonia sp. TaxID=2212373 RepID=UPI0025CC6B0B|nr:DUF192 domain-containing protein [Yoonia sp.]